MSRLYEAGQALARHLVVDHSYIPLEQALPGLHGVSQAFDAALAAFEGPDLRVHALILDEDAGSLALKAEGLRVALRSQEARIPGRIKAYVWAVAESAGRAQALRQELQGWEDGHFLSKTLVGAGVLCLEGPAWSQGRLAPQPSAKDLAAHLDPAASPGQQSALDQLAQRQADEQQARRLLQRGATPVTWALIGLNVAVYAGLFLLLSWTAKDADSASAWSHGLLRLGGLDPAWQGALVALGANDPALTLGQHQWWRLAGACFLHANLLHIAANMASLFSLGSLLERLCGPWRTLGLYAFCGLGGSLLSACLGTPGIPSVGASGAIVGLAGALLAPRFRRDPRFPKDLSGRLFSWLARPIAFVFILGFGLQILDLAVQFDNFAHLGGLLCGFGVAYIYPPFLIRKTDRKV